MAGLGALASPGGAGAAARGPAAARRARLRRHAVGHK